VWVRVYCQLLVSTAVKLKAGLSSKIHNSIYETVKGRRTPYFCLQTQLGNISHPRRVPLCNRNFRIAVSEADVFGEDGLQWFSANEVRRGVLLSLVTDSTGAW
jgi:hypothetical protein